MEKLGDLIKMRLPKHHLGQSAQAAEVIFYANELLKEFLNSGEAVKAYRLERGNLFVSTENSVWSQELWGVREKVLAKLKERFGEKAVLKIVVKCLTIDPS